MKELYVLYDANCAMCRRCRDWLVRQPAFVRLRCIPLQSDECRRLFPAIDPLEPGRQLLVISDEGAVYRGASAWMMSLWALREHREQALRLSQPALLPFARLACEILSGNRYRISRWLFWNDRAEREGAECSASAL
jgi:predicted DCC family thiol-disulfide oxidoreductase YuxK